MIRRLLSLALTQRLAMLAGVFVVICYGAWSWMTLQKEAYPDIGDTQVTVITVVPGRAAEEVEQQVTIPIERALNSVPRVISRRSKTIFGLSVVQLTFEDGTDDYFARQRVLEKLSDATLPDGVQPSLGPLTGPVGEIFRYAIRATPDHTPMELRTLQDWVIIPRLLQVPGVADVVNFGGLVKQYHVITSPDRLLRHGLTLQNVMDAIANNNVNTGGNIVPRGGQGFVVRGIGAIRTPADIENIVVATQAGVPVFIRDIASVQEFPSPPAGVLSYAIQLNDSTKENASSSIQGLIAMRRGENPSVVVEGLKQRLQDINESDLPPGVQLRITYDRSELVNYTVRTVSKTLFEGFSLVIIVLVFFIGSVRSALVVAVTIPIAMLFAFSVMKLTGIPANLLSLGAVDFGIIVDGAVVMVENIMRRYVNRTDVERERGIIRLTLTAAQEVGREIFFSIAIIILAYVPIFTLERVEGKLFRPMAFTLAFAIAGSLLLALTLIPVLMTYLFRKQVEGPGHPSIEWHNPVYAKIAEGYGRAIHVLTNHAALTVALSVAIVLLVAGLGAPRIGTEFLPQLDEGSMNIRCFFPVGMTLDEASRYIPDIQRVISSHKQTDVVLAQLGRNDDGTDPYGPNRMEILVGLKDYSTWASDTSKDDLLLKIKAELEQVVPGALFSFSQPILDNVTEAVTGSVADLAILINGPDLPLMRGKAREILNVIRDIPGASEYGIEQEGDQAQLTIQFDRAAAARFGINVSDLQRMIEAAIGGRPVSQLYEGSRRFGIVVRYAREYRGSIDAIQQMQVLSPTGARVPMSQLASVRLLDGPTIIQREDGRRQISVRTNIRGRDQGGFVKEAQEKVAKAVTLPKGYTVSWGGQYENLSRAAARLAIVIPLTLAIIFLMLFALYRHVRQVLVVMACIPFSLIGGIIALLLRGYHFNVSSGVGFV
ncbi:MAG TPA: CusA/CzcA family heavy metal efflux RND transporter, partial [Gemmatimonadaceae bacterium]|nr:CusA/CzcA family heavy metal efflux RND transporter [Gemmatimonadaceae bacterium]